MNRWEEYKAGTLTPPCVVQHDEVGGHHLIWVWWGGTEILGPYSRTAYDETKLFAHITASKEREAKFSKVFDHLGTEVKEALRWLILKIRQYPNATYAQAETQWNNEWADSLFTFAKLAAHVQRIAGDVTWAQFKTYVINHYFEGID